MQYRSLKKINLILFFGFAVLAALSFGASFFIPLTFASFLAALMEPVAAMLEKMGLRKLPASLLSTLIVFIAVSGISYLLFYQLRIFADDLPEIKEELESFFRNFQRWLSSITGVSMQEQQEVLNKRSDTLLSAIEQKLAQLLGSVLESSLKFLLVLVYLFLFLLNRGKYVQFVLMYVPEEKHSRARNIMNKTSKVIHHYLWGRLKVMSILAVMYIIAFLIFDVRYALLLTVFGALITIIPYIGPFISGVIPICFVIVFGRDFSEVLLFSMVILVIQLIESYVLEPIIIGSEVKLSPLAVIIAILIGSMIWGIAGMILFVPLFSMLKILSDHIPALRPIGYLIGYSDREPGEGVGIRIKNIFKR